MPPALNAYLYRWCHHDCTIGRLCLGDFQCFTLELPWEDNKTGISCIPKGVYVIKQHDSPANGKVIAVEDVPNRTFIQIHAGNYTRQVKGCILVGDGVKWLDGDNIPDVTNSGMTLANLRELIKGEVRLHVR